ncbi:MAG: NAD(P)/FAD-dependent oxidoreductase [Chloroflexota bacterium]
MARVSASTVDVAVVGGGPAGAVAAALLARRGYAVRVLERSPAWRWRACGVFTSPAAVRELRQVGLTDAEIDRVSRPIAAMRVESSRGASFRLTYGADTSGAGGAVGFDRSTLDPLLLDVARVAGADVSIGTTVRQVDLDGDNSVRTLSLDRPASGEGGSEVLRARVVVGADGTQSLVARSAGVVRPALLSPRVGLSWHVPDATDAAVDACIPDARMVVLGDTYVGLAPVPGGRINVGVVLGPVARRRLARDGATATAAAVLRRVRALDGDVAVADRAAVDRIEGVSPVGHAVHRLFGPGWLLVGDAAGFLDPFTGEGLHRALVSSRLAAEAIDRHLRRRDNGDRAFAAYGRAMRRRFLAKDLVTLVIQAFLARPALFEYAASRLATRASVRATMGNVIGDLAPATAALDPRFVMALLRP